ncbi:MAG: BLUF domain-containing protein [Opitutaceae bacterium]
MKLIQLVYISSAAIPLGKDDLMELLTKTQASNKKANITGLLLYRDGNFMQVLEGDEQNVLPLFETRIMRDPRHTDVTTLFKGEIPEREFPEYSMAFRDLQDCDLSSRPGYSDLLNAPFTKQSFVNDKSKARRLISIFRSGLR